MDSSKEFQLARGVEVSNMAGIQEGYDVKLAPNGHSTFIVNVSAERLSSVFEKLAAEVREPGFLLLEVASHESVELQLRKESSDPFHKDVYYLDNISHQGFFELLGPRLDLLVHDGGVNFGFGSGQGTDEVFVGPYKVLYIYADEPGKYERVLKQLGFARLQPLKTVWDNFTLDSPGKRNVLRDEDTTVELMIERLKGSGLYFAERRES